MKKSRRSQKRNKYKPQTCDVKMCKGVPFRKSEKLGYICEECYNKLLHNREVTFQIIHEFMRGEIRLNRREVPLDVSKLRMDFIFNQLL